MTTFYDIEIHESVDELKQLLSQQTKALLRDRIRALYLRKSGQVGSRRELACLLGRDESSIYRWFCTYHAEGITGLLTTKTSPGRPCRLSDEILQQLRRQLSKPEGFRSYGEVQQWLKDTFQLELPYQTVHGIVRYQLKAKLKVPRPQAHDTDIATQEAFKKNFQTSLSA
jgi:transposase